MVKGDECYTLRADHSKHTGDIKCVAPATLDVVLASSRDRTASILVIDGASDTLVPATVFSGHLEFVNFILYHPGLPLLDGEPAIITGSNDKHVVIWSISSGTMEAVLDGHSLGVRCGLVLAESSDIVTCGWDKQCIVWDSFSGRAKLCFDKHTNSVLCIAQFPQTNIVVTGSGDRTLVTWDVTSGAVRNVFRGHADSVQTVVTLNPLQFASAGNDGMVIVWDCEAAAALFQFQAHEAFIYSMCWNNDTCELYTASEDRLVTVWKIETDHATAVECVPHPCVVWSVSLVTGSTDIVTGGSDGVVRVWTRNAEHMASVEKLEYIQMAIALQKDDAKTVRIPPADSLINEEERHHHPGGRIGLRGLFKLSGDRIGTFVWDGRAWTQCGVVVQGPNADPMSAAAGPVARQKIHFKGALYDYVFDVDFNGMTLRLPYNSGQSVYDAAQMFIEDNGELGISQMDKEQIQDFIVKNIDPADAAKVGAAIGKSGNAPSEAAFSTFAKEALEMRAQGVAQASSWGERFQSIQAGNEDVAFSTFAQEGRAIATGPAASSGHATNNQQVLESIQAFTTFGGYSVDKAIAKVAETLQSHDYDHLIRSINDLVATFNNFQQPDANVEDVVTCLVALSATFPPTSQLFPIVDIYRYIFSSAPFGNACYGMASDAVLSMLESVEGNAAASDADKLCTLRLLANGLATCDAFADAILCSESVRNGVFNWIRSRLIRPINATLTAALYAVLQNAAIRCVASAADVPRVKEAIDILMATIGQAMLYDSSSEAARVYLSIVLTVQRPEALRPVCNAAVVRCLSVTLRGLKQSVTPAIAQAARELLLL